MIKIVYTILVLPQNIQERITFMKMQKKRIVQCGLSLICAFGIVMSVHAEEVDSLEDKTSNLQSQLEGINQDLVTISNEIAETEVKIEESNNEVFRLEASLQISRNNEEVQYANMKTRIKYMYENGSDTLLSMICEAKSMGEFLNRVDFIQNITKYDKDMLENMVKVREGIEEQEAELKSRHQELLDLQSQLDSEQAALQAKAEETSTDLATVNAQLEAARAAQKKQEEEALDIVRRLYESFVPNDMIGPSQVKDIYYKYFSKLDEHGLGSYISLWQKEGLESESIWEGVMNCTILRELNDLLAAKVRLFFERLRGNSVGNPVVFQIKEYIHKNYAVPSLSVPDVSEYVHLSSSYVCTIFKNETGQTLNQYLTDYRIKMSKQFLSDPRYKIADISSKVGYSDGNYYSKTFKKIVGLSPSEYREKMLA